jgi:hypothetical protein
LNLVKDVPDTVIEYGADTTRTMTLNNIQFGQILAALPTRKIQFALKYTF